MEFMKGPSVEKEMRTEELVITQTAADEEKMITDGVIVGEPYSENAIVLEKSPDVNGEMRTTKDNERDAKESEMLLIRDEEPEKKRRQKVKHPVWDHPIFEVVCNMSFEGIEQLFDDVDWWAVRGMATSKM